MDPLTLATSFATIISLIGMYRSEKSEREDESYDDFVGWLQRHQHEKLVELLADNQQIAKSTKALIEAQHQSVMESLSAINKVVCDIAAQIGNVAPLAQAMAVESSISDQAIGILTQLNRHEASKFLEARYLSGTDYALLNGDRGQLSITDSRFIEDDLNTLCEYGLLRLDFNAQGSRLFHLTRSGAQVGACASARDKGDGS
jgi:hypothetical protein